jgi:hypothetical protein
VRRGLSGFAVPVVADGVFRGIVDLEHMISRGRALPSLVTCFSISQSTGTATRGIGWDRDRHTRSTPDAMQRIEQLAREALSSKESTADDSRTRVEE